MSLWFVRVSMMDGSVENLVVVADNEYDAEETVARDTDVGPLSAIKTFLNVEDLLMEQYGGVAVLGTI